MITNWTRGNETTVKLGTPAPLPTDQEIRDAQLTRREWAIDAAIESLPHMARGMQDIRIIRDRDDSQLAYLVTPRALYTVHVGGILTATVSVAYFLNPGTVGPDEHYTVSFE